MGRDFTPRDLHHYDLEYGLTANRIHMTEADTLLWKRFPNMSYLFHESLKELYRRYEEYESALQVLDGIESDIRLMIANDDIGAYLACCDDPKDPMHILYKWYTGTLAPQFYYSEQNDRMLQNDIVKKIQKETGLYDDFDKYVYDVYTAGGVKYVVILCMAYQADDDEDGKNCRLLEYSECEMPLSDIAKMNDYDLSIFIAEHKTYISDMTEKEARRTLLTYSDGKHGAKKALNFSELTENTPDGMYIEK